MPPLPTASSHAKPLLLLVSVLLLVAFTGCGEKAGTAARGGGAKGGKGGGGAAPVTVAQAQKKKVPLVLDAIGSVEPLRTTAVRSQVNGILLRIAIREGQDVKAGDLLFEIDARPFRNTLLLAEADLQKARVQLENARAQLGRYRTLSAERMVSTEQFERMADDARRNEAEFNAAEARVANAKLQLEYCSIRAPLHGRTGHINAHEGDLVRGTDPAPLMTINQLNPINVSFGVPQQHLAAVARYQAQSTLRVHAAPPGLNEQPELGQLSFIDNAVDPSTGTIRLKATFANSGQRLWPGQFVDVTVTLAEPEVVAVPTSAVQASQRGQHVFVVNADNLAELRAVVVDRTYEADAVIAQGLTPGETVIVDGQLRVIPGRAVEIKPPVLPVAAASDGSSRAARSAAGSPKAKGKPKKDT